jgi:hypothetical protein
VTRRDPRESLEQGGAAQPKADAQQDEMLKNEEQVSLEALEEELRDFLAADMLDVPVDPVFKERLRRELWEIVEQNTAKWRSVRDDSNSQPKLELDLDRDDESS